MGMKPGSCSSSELVVSAVASLQLGISSSAEEEEEEEEEEGMGQTRTTRHPPK